MLKGYKTYITLLAGIIYKVLESNGIITVSSQEIDTSITVIILAIAALFRYFATRKQPVK